MIAMMMPMRMTFELESVFLEAYLRIVPNLGINFGLRFQIPGW